MSRILILVVALTLCGCPYRPVDETERQVIWSATRESRTYSITEVSCGGGCATAWLCSLDVQTKERGLVVRLPLASDDGSFAKRVSGRLDDSEEIVWVRIGKEKEIPVSIPSNVLWRSLADEGQRKQ
jgi:hypothetical protein